MIMLTERQWYKASHGFDFRVNEAGPMELMLLDDEQDNEDFDEHEDEEEDVI